MAVPLSDSLLKRTVEEPVSIVRKTLFSVVSLVVSFRLGSSLGWPQLLPFLQSICGNPTTKSIALELFSNIGDSLLTCPATKGSAPAFLGVIMDSMAQSNPLELRISALNALAPFPRYFEIPEDVVCFAIIILDSFPCFVCLFV